MRVFLFLLSVLAFVFFFPLFIAFMVCKFIWFILSACYEKAVGPKASD
jgi:hypothetical protein